jgi:hypothetical protein
MAVVIEADSRASYSDVFSLVSAAVDAGVEVSFRAPRPSAAPVTAPNESVERTRPALDVSDDL